MEQDGCIQRSRQLKQKSRGEAQNKKSQIQFEVGQCKNDPRSVDGQHGIIFSAQALKYQASAASGCFDSGINLIASSIAFNASSRF